MPFVRTAKPRRDQTLGRPGGRAGALSVLLILVATAASSAVTGPLFQNPRPLVLGETSGLRGLLSVDLNRDGFHDLVVVEEDGVQTLLSNGAGPFAPAEWSSRVGNGLRIWGCAAGDITGDGFPDVFLSNYDTVFTFVNDGRGSLRAGVSFKTIRVTNSGAIADMNGDGMNDIVIGSSNLSGTSEIAIHFNDRRGSFGSAVVFSSGDMAAPVVAADVNGDSRSDLIVSRSDPKGIRPWRTEVWLGVGDGTVRLSTTLSGGMSEVGDLNGDGRADLAIRDGMAVRIAFGNGDGTFGGEAEHAEVRGPIFFDGYSIAIADVDGDGDADLLSNAGAFVGVRVNRGAGEFAPPAYYLGGPGTSRIVTGDFDHDGNVDFVTLDSNGLSMIRGRGDGSFEAYRTYPTPPGRAEPKAATPRVADVNGDGRADVVALGAEQSTVVTILNDGSGSPLRYVETRTTPTLDLGWGGWIGAGDLDRDGRIDAVVTTENLKPVVAMFGNGDGTFRSGPTLLPSTDYPQSRTDGLIDVTGDGLLDFCTSSWLYAGVGMGMFAAPRSIPDGVFVDLNNDGRQDLVDVSYPHFTIWMNDGNGFVARASVSWTDGGFYELAAAGDFDGDGRVDLVVSGDKVLRFYAGNGDGSFKPPSHLWMGRIGSKCLARDVHGDGRLDLVCGTTVYVGAGDGTFTGIERFRTIPVSDSQFADFDGDGAGELFVPPYSVLWLGRGPAPTVATSVTLRHRPLHRGMASRWP